MYILLTSPIETADTNKLRSSIADERKGDSGQWHHSGRTPNIDDSLNQEHSADSDTDQLGKRIFDFDRILKDTIDHIEKQHQNEYYTHQAQLFPDDGQDEIGVGFRQIA